MATYKPEQLGVEPPRGGFKQGGWYQGRQYWGGTLGEPGVIHPQSTQAGAGRAVSKQVIAQTSPRNIAFIERQQKPSLIQTPATTLAAPSTQNVQELKQPTRTEELAPYLKSFQDAVLAERKAREAPPTRKPQEIITEIKGFVTPEIPRPAVPELAEKFQTLRAEKGVTDLEDQLVNINADIEDINARLRERRVTEEGKPVALNVISGRISEAERQEFERLDYLGRQKTRIVDELTMKYNVIDTIINLTGKDYQFAVDDYESRFKQNLQIYDAFRTQEEREKERHEKEVEFYTEERRRAEDRLFALNEQLRKEEKESARSNIQIYADLIQEGGINYDSLSSDTKLQINRMELQSGLGVGFLASLREKNPEGEVKSITTRQTASGDKYADIIFLEKDGSIRVQSQYLGKERLQSTSTKTFGEPTATEKSKAKRWLLRQPGVTGQDVKRLETDEGFLYWALDQAEAEF